MSSFVISRRATDDSYGLWSLDASAAELLVCLNLGGIFQKILDLGKKLKKVEKRLENGSNVVIIDNDINKVFSVNL